jgi:transposase
MSKVSSWVGLDVHKKDIVVAVVIAGERGFVEWTVPHTKRSIAKLSTKLKQMSGGSVASAYEAGPCGYELKRQLCAAGVGCQVVAPSLTPVRPGERIKTDRRDARKLAEMHRAGLLVEVHAPTREEESVRDLCRCREDLKQDLLRARHRLGKMLLRRGQVFRAGRNWTRRHRDWLRARVFGDATEKFVFEEYLATVELLEARQSALDEKLIELSQSERYAEPVGWLRCFRGIDTVIAMTILAELHDFSRFRCPRKLMAYLGLVPSEYSSGDSQRRGGLTKAGNSHVRRMLIEAAWHYRHRPSVGVGLRKRRRGQPAAMIALADKAQQRLYRRYTRMVLGRGKPRQKAVAAVARELAGFIWAALYLYPRQQQHTPSA